MKKTNRELERIIKGVANHRRLQILELLEKTHKKIQEAGNIIEDAVTKTRTIEKKLNKVQDLPVVEVEALVLEAPTEE